MASKELETLRMRNWILRRWFGYVRLSDTVTVIMNVSPVHFKAENCNPEFIIGPPAKQRVQRFTSSEEVTRYF